MSNERKTKIFLVDDDALFLKLLEIELLEFDKFYVETYATGELCLQNLVHQPDLIFLDYHLNDNIEGKMNGLDTLIKIKAFNPNIPVVILSAQNNIEVAINCMHHKASAYVVKSEIAFNRLRNVVLSILAYQKFEKQMSFKA